MAPDEIRDALGALAWICKMHNGEKPHQLDGKCICRCDLTTIFGPGRRVTTHQLNHLLFMIDEATALVDVGDNEEAMQRLGFIQGGLWGLGLASIDVLMLHIAEEARRQRA